MLLALPGPLLAQALDHPRPVRQIDKGQRVRRGHVVGEPADLVVVGFAENNLPILRAQILDKPRLKNAAFGMASAPSVSLTA